MISSDSEARDGCLLLRSPVGKESSLVVPKSRHVVQEDETLSADKMAKSRLRLFKLGVSQDLAN